MATIKTIYTVQDIKTGKIFKLNHTAYQVAKKHGLDKNWEVLPLSSGSASYASDNQPIKQNMDYPEYAVNVDISDKEFANPFESITEEPDNEVIKPKRKYNKKQKNG